MLQDPKLIRHYQALTDALVDTWQRGYRRTDELRLLVDGYLLALRTGKQLEPFEIYRIEDEVNRFLYDPSNFVEPELERETEPMRGY
ncbi:MAG TPA: hypothetical protein IGR15_07740 [Synechococcus sp. M44_DOE_062]|jgi:hypothetical protein|nr:hypothetical protein [Synechococcus sp. M44_DOE_062]